MGHHNRIHSSEHIGSSSLSAVVGETHDTHEASMMQDQQPIGHKDGPGYASSNNSTGATSYGTSNGSRGIAALTMRHQPSPSSDHKGVKDSNIHHSTYSRTTRPKSADYSYKSGVESASWPPPSTGATESLQNTPEFLKLSGSTTAGSHAGPPSPTRGAEGRGGGQNHTKGLSPAQKRRRANLMRVRIERGLMVGMAMLAGYRMMTLDYSSNDNQEGGQDRFYGSQGQIEQQQQQQHLRQETVPGLARSAWALGAGFTLLALVHALFLTAHDRQLQFPLHNKNLPLQPLRKRSSRYLNMNGPQAIATAAVVVADSDDESEDDEAHQRDMAAEIQQENLLQNQESTHGTNGCGPVDSSNNGGGWQSLFCRSAESAVPQWRVWGSEAHWYRKGADNGSIFATILVPVVLAAKFVQTVNDEKFLSTGAHGIRTAEAVLSNMAFSLIFGTSILLHMLLLKVFDQIGAGSNRLHYPFQQQHPRKDLMGAGRSTVLENAFMPPIMTTPSAPWTSMSMNNLSTMTNNSLYPKNTYPSHRQHQAISSPSSPASPWLSAASSAPSSVTQTVEQPREIQDTFMFSTDQLHHPSLLMGSSETDKSSDREEIWIIAFGFNGVYTCLVTLLARFKWIPGLENTGAGMVMLNQNLFQILMFGFAYFYRRSFTFGELVILAQAVTLMIHETLLMTFVTPSPPVGAVLEHPQFMFLLTLVMGMLLVGVLLTPVLMYCRRLAQMPTKGASATALQKRELKKKISAGVIYTGLVAIVLGVIMPRCERALGQNPFLWLIEFMLMTKIFTTAPQELEQPGQSPVSSTSSLLAPNVSDAKFGLETLMGARIGWSRLGLCLYWILAVGCSIAFFYWMNASIRRRSIMGSLNNRRKYYHALAVLMFIPGYLADEPFMHIAFSVGLATLIFLEYIRYFAIVPFGKEIHLFLVGFLDARDGGPIILSHLYLLMGCATPVWLAEQHILAGLSGIFALGVGDAMASIVGKRFGKHRWPGTIKTVEGTVAFVVSVMMAAGAVFVGMWVMSFVFGDTSMSSAVLGSKTGSGRTVPPASLLSFSTWNDWSAVRWTVWGVVRYGMAVSAAAMLEAVSEQNDNLVIPVIMLAMVWLI